MNLKFLLVAGLCASVLTLAPTDAAHAQRSRDTQQTKTEVLFPEATREAPKQASKRFGTKLNKAFQLIDKEQYTAAIEAAEAIANDERATSFDKSRAYYTAGYAAQQADPDDYSRAIDYLSRAIDADGLDNNTHYQLIQQVAQLHVAEEQHEKALGYVDRFLRETHQKKPEVLIIKGNALYRLERYEDAIAAIEEAVASTAKPAANWMQLLMATYVEAGQPARAAGIAERIAAEQPGDKRALQNLASIYMQADQPDKAGEVFDRMRVAGLMTESRDYENAYRLLANIEGRENDAIAVIKEGLDKGVLEPSHEVYQFLGQVYYFSDRPNEAIEAWKKAAPLAADGETYLNLAKVLVMEERYAEGKAAAHSSLEKGVRKPGDAWMAIARAEFAHDGKNRAAILAAYQQAAKYPETKEQALRQIKQMSR